MQFMQRIYLSLLLLTCLSSLASAQNKEIFSNAVDALFASIKTGQIPDTLLTGKDTGLTRTILLNYRPIAEMRHELINEYPLEKGLYRLMIVCDTLRELLTLDARLEQDQVRFALPLWYDSRNWKEVQAGTVCYHYDHDFEPKAAKAFDAFNRQLAGKLGLQPMRLEFYLTDNYQQIQHLFGFSYDRSAAGKTRDGSYANERTIFAIMHNEDFSHDLVHYYVSLIRKSPRNSFAEEGLAYYWGNAYYTDSAGQMIPFPRIKRELQAYLVQHPEADLLSLFRQDARGLFGSAAEVSLRSALSAVLMEAIEKEQGVSGVLRLINCGSGEQNYFSVLEKLTSINTSNFDERLRRLCN
jgi:hypothetical protein